VKENGTALPAGGAVVDTAAAALGLPGFVVLAAAEYGGELELLIETTESVVGCPRCGVLATLHDRKPRWVRDLPAGGRPVVLVWFKRCGAAGSRAARSGPGRKRRRRSGRGRCSRSGPAPTAPGGSGRTPPTLPGSRWTSESAGAR
jgi:zinc-finger of transposase IS204/IS1001/IS1096/IS1165